MGMYTEIVFACRLKRDTPEQVIKVLDFMANAEFEKVMIGLDEEYKIDHEFFRCARWDVLFRMDSYYFDGETNSIFRKDNTSNQYSLTFRSNLKNYDREIEKFLRWIKPYIETYEKHKFLGYYRYEESEEPTLIYYDEIESEDK